MGRSLPIALILLIALDVVAQSPPTSILDPEQNYVQSPNPEFNGLIDDKLLRLDLDLRGDAKPTIFLTVKKFGSRSGYTWTAYVPNEGGGYKRIDYTEDGQHTIQFRTDLYHAGMVPGVADAGALLALYPGKGGGNLVRFDFRNGSAHFSVVRTLDYTSPSDRELFAAIFKREVDKPLEADESSSPPYQVLSVASIREKSSSARPSQSVTDSLNGRLATTAPSPLSPNAKIESARQSEGKPTPWLFLVGGISVVFVVVFWVLKRRR